MIAAAGAMAELGGPIRVVAHCLSDAAIGMGHAVRLGAVLDHCPRDFELVGCVEQSAAEAHFPDRMERRPATAASAKDAVVEGRQRGAFVVAVFDLHKYNTRQKN